MNTITPEMQGVFERATVTQIDRTPEICGYHGRACRRMGGVADRAICMRCPLAEFAETGIVHIAPEAGRIYTHCNGERYLCVASPGYMGENTGATMKRLTDGWMLKVHEVHQHADGTITWRYPKEWQWLEN